MDQPTKPSPGINAITTVHALFDYLDDIIFRSVNHLPARDLTNEEKAELFTMLSEHYGQLADTHSPEDNDSYDGHSCPSSPAQVVAGSGVVEELEELILKSLTAAELGHLETLKVYGKQFELLRAKLIKLPEPGDFENWDCATLELGSDGTFTFYTGDERIPALCSALLGMGAK